MSTIVYLSNKQVQVVTGVSGNKKITLKQCYAADMPEGCMINGMIMDQELFTGFMRSFWQMNKLPSNDVNIVINSSKFVGKTIEAPLLKDEKTLEFIEREFTEIDRDEERVYGFVQLGKPDEKKNRKIYAESVSAEFIKEYKDLFSEIGIKIKAVYSGESSIIGLTAATVGRQHKTFVLEIADNMTLTTILWVDGMFYYYNSVRCFHEQGTEEYALDVARSVSQIIQFMQAHQIEHGLECVVLAGINPQHVMLYQEAIRQQGAELPVMVFSDREAICSENNYDPQNFLFAASGLLTFGKWQNFLTNFGMKKKKDGSEGGFGKGIVAIAITFAVMLVILGVCITIKMIRNNELEEIKDYNDSVIPQVAEVEALTIRNNFLYGQYSSIEDLTENINTYPVCNKQITSVISKCAAGYADVSIEAFDSENGTVTILAEANEVEQINKFISQLNGQDIFAGVNYTGYSFSNETGLWDIHVTCILKESAGR